MRHLLTILITLGTLLLIQNCSDPCDDLNCGPNGNCVDGTCQCDEGFFGTNCEQNVCDDVNCGENGSCVNGNCECEPGYSGDNCEINVCDTVDCGPNGTCDTTNGNCVCDDGYEGDNCESEVRSKFFGTYFGDMNPCIPALLAGLIPDEIKESLELSPLEVTASDMGIYFVSISVGNELLGFEIETDLNEESFVVPAVEEDVEIEGFSLTIAGEGTGRFIDENTIEMDLVLNFQSGILQANSECLIEFTK